MSQQMHWSRLFPLLFVATMQASAGPLHDAARSGNAKRLAALVGEHDINATNEFGFTPLLLAQLNNHGAAVDLLRNNGAQSGLTALTELTQHWLKFVGLDPGPIDGKLGESTRNALRSLQRREKLTVNGRLNEASVRRLQRTLLTELQSRLRDRGLYDNQLDGIAGPATEAAIRQAERKFGLPDSGTVTVALLSKLVPRPTTKSLDRKTDPSAVDNTSTTAVAKQRIIQIQKRLRSLGYEPGPADGKIGARSAAAIREFEKRAQQQISGLPTVALLQALEDENAPRAAVKRKTTKNGNTVIKGALQFERASDGTVVGCSIKGVQFERSWCMPFVKRPTTESCKAILRADSSVLLVRCS